MQRTITSVFIPSMNTSYNVMNCANPMNPCGTGSRSVVCERIVRVDKNGEYSPIPWLEIHTGMGGMVEVREHDCIIGGVERGEA